MIEKNISNLNHIWASLTVEELVRCGVDYFCISPGSRSAPLAIAVAKNKRARSFIHFDERGIAFHALGYTAASKKAACIITTSGTAVANLLPAVIETFKKKLPMVILTADRPPELRFTGANQTIDQVKIFGEYVNWFFDMPTPTSDIKPGVVLTTVDQAVARAYGYPKGPVHINCMYREPLEPTGQDLDHMDYLVHLNKWHRSKNPLTTYIKSEPQLSAGHARSIAEKLNTAQYGLIVAGKLSGKTEEDAVLDLADKLQWPILPDISSGLRLGNKHPSIIHYFDQVLTSENFSAKYPADCILHLGGRITSKRFYDYVSSVKPNEYITVLNHPLRNDPLQSVTTRVECTVQSFCKGITGHVKRTKRNPQMTAWKNAGHSVEAVLAKHLDINDRLSEPSVCRNISQIIQKGTNLFIGNSLPIREMDMYADHTGSPIVIGANRGASGIDGTIATAIGFTAASDKKTTLLIGDLAFLYDLNSLSMLRFLKSPLIMIILNNNGGGIFSFLPISKYNDVFEKYFGTPHYQSFEAAAKMFNVNYAYPRTLSQFADIYKKALSDNRTMIIEIKTGRDANHSFQQQLHDHIRKAVDQTLLKKRKSS